MEAPICIWYIYINCSKSPSKSFASSLPNPGLVSASDVRKVMPPLGKFPPPRSDQNCSRLAKQKQRPGDPFHNKLRWARSMIPWIPGISSHSFTGSRSTVLATANQLPWKPLEMGNLYNGQPATILLDYNWKNMGWKLINDSDRSNDEPWLFQIPKGRASMLSICCLSCAGIYIVNTPMCGVCM